MRKTYLSKLLIIFSLIFFLINFTYGNEKKNIDLVAKVDAISKLYAEASIHANWYQRMQAVASINVLHRDLKQSLKQEGRHLLEEDPLGLLSKESLQKSLDEFKRKKRQFELHKAHFDLPETNITLKSLVAEIERIEAIIASDQPGKFRKARDDLANSIDVDKWETASKLKKKHVKEELRRLSELNKVKYPGLKILFYNPPDHSYSPVPKHHRSKRILESILAYKDDPYKAFLKEASLRAEFFEIMKLPRQAKIRMNIKENHKYPEWMASQLSNIDLNRLISYSQDIVNSSPKIDLPFGPQSVEYRYHKKLLENLKNEKNRRANGGASGRDLHPYKMGTPEYEILMRYKNDPYDHYKKDAKRKKLSSKEKVFFAQAAVNRYGSIDYMPKQISDELKEINKEVFQKDFERAEKIYRKIIEYQESAALITKPLKQEQLSKLRKARESLSLVLLRLDKLTQAKEMKGYIFGKRNELNVMLRLLGNNPPPVESGQIPGFPSPKPSPKNPTGLTLYDAVLESRIITAESAVNALPKIEKQAMEPEKYARNEGLRIAAKEKVWNPSFNFSKMERDKADTRRRKILKEYKGKIDPRTGKPYDFETQVRDFKSFEAVGGGIHMGGIAELSEKRNISDFILKYDDKKRKMILIGPKGQLYGYGPIEPTTLKILYRFAKSGQNQAISIGWSGFSDFSRRFEKLKPVLLDPYFVNTKVGQDLFLADSLPWGLDKEKLPNGKANPVWKEFEEVQKKTYGKEVDSISETIKGWIRDIKPFGETEARYWISKFSENERVTHWHLITLTILLTDTLEQAKDLTSHLPNENSKIPKDLLQSFKEFSKNVFNELPHEKKDALLMISASAINRGIADKAFLQLYYSILQKKDKSINLDRGAARILILLPSTTLAVLINEPTTFSLKENFIILEGTMRWRYATRLIRKEETGIYFHDSENPENEVRDLKELSNLANGQFEALTELYPPLKRVGEYSRILAFLRWAIKEGNLAGIDFSSLAQYHTSNPSKTPTPDVVTE